MHVYVDTYVANSIPSLLEKYVAIICESMHKYYCKSTMTIVMQGRKHLPKSRVLNSPCY